MEADAPVFSKVELRSANVRQVRGQDLVDFQLHCDINPTDED